MRSKERVQQVSTPEELRELMRELRAHGSPGWKYSNVSTHMHSDLWEELRRHFGEDERLGGAGDGSRLAVGAHR